jgi:hypothetical protein
MSSLDKFQILTLALGAAIIVSVLVEYNDTDFNVHAKAGLKTLESALPFFLASYALIVSGAPNSEARMYKNIILLIVAVTWVTVFYKELDPSTGVVASGGGWEQVNGNVTYPLALGGLFALPVVLCGFRV